MQAMGVAHFLIFSLLACSCMAAHHQPAPRKEVRVEGSVWCIYCAKKNDSVGALLESALLPGAVVKLQCNNTNKSWEEETTTDSSGGFVFSPKKTKVTTWGARKCKVFTVSSPRNDCPYLDDLNDGVSGAVLKPTRANSNSSSQLYTVGPFAFQLNLTMCF